MTSNILTSSHPHILSIAPMMDYTDRHCRYFLRLISQHILLYTEMITTGAILHGDKNYLLAYHPAEHPVAIQLGGSHPKDLAACAKIAEDFEYDEINLNIGCPSDHVTVGHFGACLMKEPELVAAGVAAMISAVNIPVTVKTRIGVDDYDSYDHLKKFIVTVANAGCKIFIIHARKAWLKGLSPKENREIPPLHYEIVYQLKKDFPHLAIIINGGIKTLWECEQHLQQMDGVMIGREAYHNPYLLAEVDNKFYGEHKLLPSRLEILKNYLPYMEEQLAQGVHLNHLTHPLMGLFHGEKGARAWRRYLSEHVHKTGVGIEVIKGAMENIKE